MQAVEKQEVKSTESSKSELGSEVLQRDIEITPEMMEAGLIAYIEERPGETSGFNEKGVVEAIFKAMLRIHRIHIIKDINGF